MYLVYLLSSKKKKINNNKISMFKTTLFSITEPISKLYNYFIILEIHSVDTI